MSPAFVEHLASPLVAPRPVELRLVSWKPCAMGWQDCRRALAICQPPVRAWQSQPPVGRFLPPWHRVRAAFLRPARRRNETDPRCQPIQKSFPAM